MKLSFTLLALGGLAQLAAAQNLTITDEQGEAVNGTTIVVNGGVDVDLGEGLEVVNNTANSAQVNVKRYELEQVPGSMNYFCWFECYAPAYSGAIPLWVAPEPLVIGSGESQEGFHAYYRAMNIEGVSAFRYVWYFVNDPTDSAYVDIVFNAAPVGMEDLTSRNARLDVSPNPSNGAVTFQFDAVGAGRRQLVLHNALGERVGTQAVSGAQRRVVLGEGTLASGVWFASLEVEGRVVATRRFIISGH